MKKLIYFLLIGFIFFVTGCFETTEEITINKDGSGIFSNTTDLSSMVALLKQMGGDDTAKFDSKDTTILLAGLADSIAGLSEQQKKIINQGSMNLALDLKDEKLVIKLNFPFQKINDISVLKQVLPKVSEAVVKKLPGTQQMPPGLSGGDSSKIKTFDDFYDLVMTDHVISKTLNKERYAGAENDDFMKSMKQMSGMGSPITASYIINLPRPASKAEGKAIKLSDDKMRATLTVTSDDFFEDPSKFEYQIVY